MRTLVVSFCVLFAFMSLVGMTWAKDTRDGRFSNHRFVQLPQSPSAPSGSPDGSMFKAAAAGTTVLGFWNFDTPEGGPDPQGWIITDGTAPIDTNFHVNGSAGGGPGCCPITPINGFKSMWCGQCPTMDPRYCGYATLPGYGNNWIQSLESQTLACTTLTVSYTAIWDSEPGYDFTYVQYWDGVQQDWVDLPINGGLGYYTGSSATPVFENVVVTPPDYSTRLRFHFESDGAWSDQDGLWPTNEGAFKVDDITVSCSDEGGEFNYFEDWEDEVCGQRGANTGIWVGGATASPPGHGVYAHLLNGVNIVQEDPCRRLITNMWGFFDDPAVTNYACGGWPQQGAVPYGPDDNGLYMYNEIWSPKVPYAGSGDEVELTFKVYRDLNLDALVFYMWHIRAWVDDCPISWEDISWVYYGDQKDWFTAKFSVGSLIASNAEEVQVALGAIDACNIWCGVYGTGACHSHAPLFDDVKLVRIDSEGPQWAVRDIDLFQDDFPQEYDDPTLSVTGYGRADMAADILPSANPGILPGDSIAFRVTHVVADGVNPPSVYLFASVEDRFGNTLGVLPTDNGLPYPAGQPVQGAMMSPEVDVPTGTVCRFPNVTATVPGGLPAGWYQFQCDYCYTTSATPSIIPDRFCADLMDMTQVTSPGQPARWWEAESGGPSGIPGPYGTFLPSQPGPPWQNGMVIRYFLGAHDASGRWTFWHRQNDRQGSARLYTMEGQTFGNVQSTPPWDEACEFSILPDAGNRVGDDGDILFVDDADDRGGGNHAQYYFDTCFDHMGILDRVDRFDVLGPSSCVANSLASRARSAQYQMIGGLWEIYQKVLWNSSDLGKCLVCDGGTSGGTGPDKSNDWALLESFMDFHSWNDPGNFFAGDDMAEDWATLAGGASYRAKYMTYNLVTGDHKTVGLRISPMVYQNIAMPIGPDSMWAFGGCPGINDFDVMSSGSPGVCLVNSSYDTPNDPMQGAKMTQATPNLAARTARCVLEGFGFDFIRDDQTNPPQTELDRCVQLYDILTWFQNILDEPVGIDPVAFENRLDNAFPNPFNPTTTVRYGIAEQGHVSLRVYNAAGQLVKTLVDGVQTPRTDGFSVTWDGTNDAGQDVSSGVYFCRLVTKGFTQTKKTVLLK